MKNTLYNISNDYNEIMSQIKDNDGEITEEISELLVINEKELETKSRCYLEVIKSSKAFISTIDDEMKRLQALKKRNNSLIDKLESSLLGAVQLFGEFTIGTLTFGARKSEQVIVENANHLPNEYITRKVTEQANKADLKKALKNGEEIDGVHLQTNFNLKIK